jgi:hypothetical protein
MPRSNDGGFIDWDAGRQGNASPRDLRVPALEIRKPAKSPAGGGTLLSIRAQESFGSLISAAGTIWAVYVATVDYNNLWRMQLMPPGPVEVCALGILAWLHAKWRRSINAG